MAKVKQDLDSKSDAEVLSYALAHKTAIIGKPEFATPDPTALIYDPVVAEYSDLLDEITQMEAALASKRAAKEAKKAELKLLLAARASWVQKASKGSAEIILMAAFEIQADGAPTTSLPQPQNLVATTGKNEGEADVGCAAVKKAKVYFWECREHVEGQVPGPWTQFKVSGTSSITATALVSGRKYAFRVRVLGPNETESPWSDEAVCRAA